MAMNFEKHIQNSMENFEFPYDAAAWTAVSEKLDRTMPVTKSFPKWWIVAACVTGLVLTFVSYPLFSSTTQKEAGFTKKNTQRETATRSKLEAARSNEELLVAAGANSTSNITSGSEKTKAKSLPAPLTKQAISTEKWIENTMTPASPPPSVSAQKPEGAYFIPAVTTTCVGKGITINNTNPVVLVLQLPNDKKTVINPHDNLHMGAAVPGEYQLGIMKEGQFLPKEKFAILPAVKADMEISDSEFENGLPTIHFSAINTAADYLWECNQQTSTGKQGVAHFFHKGTYEIQLTTTAANGCTSTDKKKITVLEDYNLLATTAFNPTDEQSKNKTWIPNALKTRNVSFELTIFDPIDGGILYQTRDASQPWDGIDRRTGHLVPYNANCIWTVKLNNPEPGERANYKGVIIRL
jgi:hypothetical protein